MYKRFLLPLATAAMLSAGCGKDKPVNIPPFDFVTNDSVYVKVTPVVSYPTTLDMVYARFNNDQLGISKGLGWQSKDYTVSVYFRLYGGGQISEPHSIDINPAFNDIDAPRRFELKDGIKTENLDLWDKINATIVWPSRDTLEKRYGAMGRN